jgi:hypothetical protein
MNFGVLGPFEIVRFGGKNLITKASKAYLENALEEERAGLSEACGCYVFAVKAGRGYTPHYVGQASRQPIAKEALNPTNQGNFNELLGRVGKGTPVLFVIPLLTPGGKFRKRTISDGGLDVVDFLEQWLITIALAKNPDLINSSHTRHMRNVHVPGMLNSNRGEHTLASRKLKRALGL